MRDPHIWDDEPKKLKVARLKEAVAVIEKNVQTLPTNVQTIPEKIPVQSDNVQTIRQIGLRELGRALSREFMDLPFEVTKNGRVIARVEKV
jgi:hypothetical protein